VSPVINKHRESPQYEASPDHRAELDARREKWSKAAALSADAERRKREANAEIADCLHQLEKVAPDLWAQSRFSEAEELEKLTVIRRQRALDDKLRAERQHPAAQRVVGTAKGEYEAAVKRLLPYLVVDVENGPVARFEEVRDRAVAVLSELFAARSAVEEALLPLKPALKEHIEASEDYPSDGRLALVIRVQHLPIDGNAVIELQRFDVRTGAMQAVLDDCTTTETT
jgi:hypothetical protein